MIVPKEGVTKVKHTATGRVGLIINIHAIPVTWDDNTRGTWALFEIAFPSQLYTECFSAKEISFCDK